MKKLASNILICAFALSANAQIIHFSYDSSGNRISRVLLDSNPNNARTRGIMRSVQEGTPDIYTFDDDYRCSYSFDGALLYIRFNKEIKTNRFISIYSLDGIRLFSQSSKNKEVVFDLSEVTSSMFIVTIQERGKDNQVVKIQK